jgi:membrane protein
METHRGRSATEPESIPPPGWWDILVRVWKAIGNDHVTLVASGLAMYALLAIFPGLAAAVSIYGLFATPADVVNHMQSFAGVMPPGTWDLLKDQLQTVASHSGTTLSIAALGTLAIALWGARSGIAALMVAMNIAYSQPETRGFFRQILISLALTLGALAGFLVMLAIAIGLPLILKVLGTTPLVEILVNGLRWVVLWLMIMLGLAILYRYAPARHRARWRWVTWGSAIAATLWIGASLAFSWYVTSFATYGKTYGALGGVIALLMWLYVSSFMVVLGAEINAEMERQTRRDTTQGPEKPLGERGAFAADTVGEPAGTHR